MLRLKRPLRPSSNADPEDTLATKLHLADLGFYEPPTGEFHQWPDAEMFAGIRMAQQAAGENVDGEMLPGGPTEAVINKLSASRPPIPREKPNDYQRAIAKGLARPEEAISEAESWSDSVHRQTGMRPTPAALPLAIVAVPSLLEAAGAVAGGVATGAALYGLQRWLGSAPSEKSVADASPPMQPEGRHREALPPEKQEPLRGPSAAEIDRINKEASKPLAGPPPQPIKIPPEIFPIPDPAKPEIFIFPDMSGELPDTTILESRWGNDKTKAELNALNDAILGHYKDWKLRGGVPFGKEYWFPGPGSAFLDEEGNRGDGRPGGRWADLTYELPDGTLVVVQHADVDKNGEIEQHELDAARSISRPGVTVYIVPKQWQLDRVRDRSEKKRGKH